MEHDRDSDDLVTLVVRSDTCGSDSEKEPDDIDDIAISMAEISNRNLPSLANKVLKVKVDPKRLIEESSYFRGLLSGSFREGRHNPISINWNSESFLAVLRFIFRCHVEITSENFVSLNEAALFFGVDVILLKCRDWLEEVTSFRGFQPPQLCLDGLIHIWEYAIERANDVIIQLCTSYLARNFMWASSFKSFNEVPEKFLCSSIQNPDLTVDSEKHLCEAILSWLIRRTAETECLSSNYLCHKIRTSLLPLWFASGKQTCPIFSTYVDKAIEVILNLTRHPRAILNCISTEGDLSHLRIRLTKYTQKVDISSCPQITADLFLISLIPSCGTDLILRKIMEKYSGDHARSGGDHFLISQALERMLIFDAVQEMAISNCPSLLLESAIVFFCKSFPSLQTLRAAYFLNFKTKRLCQLVQKFPLLTTIDLTLDINPVIPSQSSTLASSLVERQQRSTGSADIFSYHSTSSLSFRSNITKLILVGRTDMSDSDLLNIAAVCHSLNYVDMEGCTSVTDNGISVMIMKCRKLQSVLMCDTLFAEKSISALCSGISSGTQQTHPAVYNLLILHIGGCHGADGKNIFDLMAGADHLTSLCLREIKHVDDALYGFLGASLERLDVSDTKVSCAILSRVVSKNHGLKSLKTRGCSHLSPWKSATEGRTLCGSSDTPEEWYFRLGKSCKLDEIELGWGISLSSIAVLKPALRTLRTLVVGLGGSLGEDGLKLLPCICEMLETLILYFQVISVSALTCVLRTLPHLQHLALCYCFGDISLVSFELRMPNLRCLKLERVTPWMTNRDLTILAENCSNLLELSLIGCTLLDSEAQAIVTSGWPGLTSLRLEECGEITSGGVRSILDCYALEDLKLRHTGPGIPRNFILDAASKLPMLRKITLDVCDARDGDFDIPSFSNRYFLSIVKIARCKLQKVILEAREGMYRGRTPVHKETLVLSWDSEKLVRTVVKERL